MTNLKNFSNILSLVEKTGDLLREGTQIGERTGNSFRIPLEMVTNDSGTLEIMQEFELYKPENMVKFLVESFDGAIEAIQNEIQDLKLMQIDEQIGKVHGAKGLFDYAMENPDNKKDKLNTAQDMLFPAIFTLEKYIVRFIDSTREIDNKPKWKFFVNAKEFMSTIDSNIRLIRVSLDALEEAVTMQMLIAKELGANIDGSIIQPYCNFYDKALLSRDTCRLLDAYEFQDRKKEKYFLRLGEKKQNIKKFSDAYEKYEEYVDELAEYDEVIFG